jgi:Xaa-Pro aminopeptidase
MGGMPSIDHAARRSRLAALLADRDLDGALVTHPANVRYLTGLASSNAAVLVPLDGTAALATDDRYAEAAAQSCVDVEVISDRDVAAALVRHAGRQGWRRIGLERDHVSLSLGERLAGTAQDQVELGDLGGAVETLRADKEPGEVALVEQACQISAAALAALLADRLRGRSEFEVARDLEARMLALGAEGLAFESIVASGPNGAIPHHTPGDRVIAVGDLLTIDFGARVGGYHADCTRTVMVGREPADWQREVYELVQKAQQAGVDALAPGTTTTQVDAAARTLIRDAGYGDFFTHGLGHGVGLEIHEPPWLAGDKATASTLGGRSTVTVEPGIYLPGKGGVRIEDTTDVGGDGVRVLTKTTRSLLVVD